VSPLASALGFVALPAAYWPLLMGTVASCLLVTQVVKMWLPRRGWIRRAAGYARHPRWPSAESRAPADPGLCFVGSHPVMHPSFDGDHVDRNWAILADTYLCRHFRCIVPSNPTEPKRMKRYLDREGRLRRLGWRP